MNKKQKIKKELPCTDRATGDDVPMSEGCPAVSELKRIKAHFLKSGAITCLSCEHGPYHSGTEECTDCDDDFNNWEPDDGPDDK